MILVLQTAGFVTNIWLLKTQSRADGSGRRAEPPRPEPPRPDLVWESGRELAAELLGKITTLLRQHDAELSDLKGIVVFSGPGSFTSLRIGHTVANALADSLGIPVVGAAGDNWLANGLAELRGAPTGQSALPVYGSDPHITQQKH